MKAYPDKLLKLLFRNWIIVTIFLVALFFRLYRIEAMTAFQGEQGRDLLIAREIFRGKVTFLGPPTSISNVHFGPFYHYFNAFFLLFSGFDPIGAVFGFTLLSMISVYLIYSFAENLGHKKAGYFAAFLYAVSPRMIEYGKHIFNSNFMHYFSIFVVWSVSRYFKTSKKSYLFWAGIFAGLAFQANFLFVGLLAGIVLLFFWRRLCFKKQIWFYSGTGLSALPYLAFELRHQFYNIRAFFSLSSSGKAVSFSPLEIFKKIIFNFQQVSYFSFSYDYPNWLSYTFFLIFVLGLIILLFKNRKDELLGLTSYYLSCVLLGVSLYPGPSLVHYLGASYPFVFLLMGLLLEKLFYGKFRILAYFVFIAIVFLNLLKINYSCQRECGMPDGWDLDGVRRASAIIHADAEDDFNIANILDGDTRAYSYRYFVQLAGKKPLAVEQYPQSAILYVIAREDEDILNYPVWEINSFLPAKITQVWPVKNGINIFKLEKI